MEQEEQKINAQAAENQADKETNNQETAQQPEAQAQEQTQEQTQENAQEQPAQEQAANAEVENLKKQLAELNDKYIRTVAEYDNYRKRTAKEKADLSNSAKSEIIAALLPVIDDFERALTHMGPDADVAAVKEGVDFIYKKFIDFLTKRGVSVIETKGLELDTNRHEAITMMPAPTPDQKGKIFDCVEKGYMLGDKVIRFAKVVVCQ